jgi:hypothetical protein
MQQGAPFALARQLRQDDCVFTGRLRTWSALRLWGGRPAGRRTATRGPRVLPTAPARALTPPVRVHHLNELHGSALTRHCYRHGHKPAVANGQWPNHEPRTTNNQLFDDQLKALRMAVELRGVHALDAGHAGLVIAPVLDAHGILEHVGALREVINEEMTGGVARLELEGFEILRPVNAGRDSAGPRGGWPCSP